MLYGILFLVFFTVYKNNATSNLRNGTIYNNIISIIPGSVCLREAGV